MHPVWGTFGDTCSGRYFAVDGMWKQRPENGIGSKQKCEEKEEHVYRVLRIWMEFGACIFYGRLELGTQQWLLVDAEIL